MDGVILIVVKWPVRPELSDSWPSLVADFTQAVRAEEGNVSFEWSRSLEDPHTWVLVEMFRDAEAGAAHTGADHFRAFTDAAPDWVARQPEIVFVDSPDSSGWGPMGEVQPR